MKKHVQLGSLTILLAALGTSGFTLGFARNKSEPFTGDWVSKQFTNGKEFHLKIQQNKNELIGWEGRLPPQQLPEPDFTGSINGKEAEIEIAHRRGYKAHVKLSIRGDRLVWQLLDGTERSSRYFPLASTLKKTSVETKSTQTIPAAPAFNLPPANPPAQDNEANSQRDNNSSAEK